MDQHFEDLLEETRVQHLLDTAPDATEAEDNSATPRAANTPAATPTSFRPIPAAPEEERRRGRGRATPSRSPSTSPTPAPKGKGRKRRREPTPEPVDNPFPDPQTRTRASPYLIRRCPACFYGLTHDPEAVYVVLHSRDSWKLIEYCRADLFVCVDACFTQKRNQSDPDPPKTHPGTHFVSEALAEKMADYVESVRPPQPSQKPNQKKSRKATVQQVDDEDDCYEHPKSKLAKSFQDTCESSFTAADERREKASTRYYADTGCMALLCRHDRVLFLVNMHSAGEKQFYVLLLVEMLFQHLPLAIKVGLLYDIACQLERSALKWDFLARYLDRLAFAVAVFHAFGHDWACQLVYHPHKIVGFGFTNGEGCERFWHAISHLIAHLRISSVSFLPLSLVGRTLDSLIRQYHHRVYTLDTQVKHADEASLFKLAEWNHRRGLHSTAKRVEATEAFKDAGHSLELLRKQWADQVATQTKPLPRKSVLLSRAHGSRLNFLFSFFAGRSKNQGEKAVAIVLALREAVATLNDELSKLNADVRDALDHDDYDRMNSAKEEATKMREARDKAQRKVRVKEQALGVDGRAKLQNQKHVKYFQLRMNARAHKQRLRDLLRAHKFERDGVERTSRRHQASGTWTWVESSSELY